MFRTEPAQTAVGFIWTAILSRLSEGPDRRPNSGQSGAAGTLAYRFNIYIFRYDPMGPGRFHNARHIIGAAGFQQQHGDVRIFSQPARYHRTGGARTTDDEVVVWP